MGEVTKPDTLEMRIAALERDIDDVRQNVRRGLSAIDSLASDSTFSTSYVDLGPTLADIRPGPSGRWMVGVGGTGYFIEPGGDIFISYRIAGPTSIAASDDWAFNVGQGFNADIVSVAATRFHLSPQVPDGIYSLVMTIRSGDGQLVTAFGREIMAMPL